MNSHSLSLERNAQSFELSAVSTGVPTSAKFQMDTINRTTRIKALLNGTRCVLTRPHYQPFRQNSTQKSTSQNGAEGVFSGGVGGLPLQLANNGLNVVLEGFAPSHRPKTGFLAFPRPRHLPSSHSNPAAMFLLRSSREKSPHPARIQNDGLFWPANRKGCPLLCAQSGAQCLGSTTLPWILQSGYRAHPRTSARKFASAPPALACFCSRRLVRRGMNMRIHSLPHPGARAGVFAVAA